MGAGHDALTQETEFQKGGFKNVRRKEREEKSGVGLWFRPLKSNQTEEMGRVQ